MTVDHSRLEQLVYKYHHEHRAPGTKTLAKTLDAAYEVLAETEALLNGGEQPTERQRAVIDKAARIFLRICSSILNVTTHQQVVQAMQDRNAKRAFRPEYIPGQTETLRTQFIDPNTATNAAEYQWRRVAAAALMHKQEMIGVVNEESRLRDLGQIDLQEMTIMFTDAERDALRVFVNTGVLVRFNRQNAMLVPFDTGDMRSHGKMGFASFVLTIDGELFVFNHLDKTDRIAHSSATRGGPVIGAGEICVQAGQLRAMTTYSGHYHPGLTMAGATLRWFQSKGVDLSNTVVNFMTDPGLELMGIVQPVALGMNIEPSDPNVRQLHQIGDIDSADVRAYMGITRHTYRATDVLNPFG